MENNNTITIGYWGGFHGLGLMMKLTAELAGVKYDFASCNAREEFYGGLDTSLDTNMPNLPYIIDNGKVLTQSLAIMNYLAYKGGKEELIGKTPCEKVKILQLIGVAGDIRSKFVMKNFSNQNFHAEKENEFDAIKVHLHRLNKELGHKKFFTGDHVTIADINFFQVLSVIHKVYGSKFDEHFDHLHHFLKHFKEVHEVHHFFESDRFNKDFPFLPPHCALGV